MKNIVLIFATLDIICITGLTYKFCNKLYNLKPKCEVEYEYTDFLGKKGSSKHCYEENGIFICRTGKKGVKVIKIEKKEICENGTK